MRHLQQITSSNVSDKHPYQLLKLLKP